MNQPNTTNAEGLYYQALFAENKSTILIIDPETGEIIDANRAACEYYGYGLENLKSLRISDINSLTDGELKREMQRVMNGERKYFLFKHRLANGDVRDVEVHSGAITVGSRQLLYSLIHDISDTKKAEKELLKREERWKFALNETTDGVWDFNIKDNTIYYSPQWKMMLGYADDEIGNTFEEWSSRVHPDDLEHAILEVQHHIEGKTDIYRVEYRLRCKNGSYKWILDEGKVVTRDKEGNALRFIGTHKDISERVKTDFELKERLKELKCHNLISEVLSKPHLPLDYVCQSIANIIPTGWQFPEIAGACIQVNDYQYQSENYTKSEVCMSQDILLNNKSIGHIHVSYPNAIIKKHHPVFLAEEMDLLFAISVNISNYIENNRAQTELRQAKERYENLINNINDAICEMDEHGVFLFVSPIIEKILGYKPEEIVGKSFMDFSGLNNIIVEERFYELQQNKFSEHEYQMPTKSGEICWVIISAKATYKEGKFAGLTATMKDITKSKLTEIEYRKTELLYQSFVNASNDSLCITDLNGIVEYASPRTNEMFGYHESVSFVGLPMMDFIHPSNHNLAAERLGEMFERNYGIQREYIGMKGNGDEFDIEVVGGFIYDENGQRSKMIFNTRDITERKAAQRAINESEEKYQKAFSTSPYGIAISTLEYGIFIDVNEMFTRYMGYSRDELLHKSAIELHIWVNPEDRMEISRNLKAGINLIDKEVQFRHKSGKINTALYSGSTIMLNNKRVILSNIVDISEKKENERQIKLQNERLEAIFDAMPDLLFVLDHEGTYLEAYCSNPELLLIPVEDIPGNNIRNIFPPEESVHHLKKINECIEKHEVITYQYALPNKGIVEYFEARIAPMGSNKILSLIRNITNQKEKEDEIRKLQIAVEQSPVSIVITDLEAKIEYANPAFIASSGYNLKELIGTHTRLLKSGQTDPKIYQDLWQKIKNGENWSGEWQTRRKSGELLWEEISINPIINSEGEIVNYLAIKQDITARKKAEKEILDLNSNLEKRIKERTNLLELTNERLKKEIVERVRIEQALSKSEKNYRTVVENVNEVIFKTDADGLWVFLNKSWEEITGFTVEESIGELFLNYVHPDDRELNAELFAPLISREKEYCRHEIRYLTKSGGFRWIEVFARLGLDDNGSIAGTYGTLQDITERKRNEEAILWNQTLMQLMAGSSPFGFLVVDNRTDEILYFNHRFCEIWDIEHISAQMQNGELKNNDIIPYCIPVLEDVEAFAESCKPLQDESNRIVVNDEIAFTNNRTIRRYSTQIRGLDDQYFGRFYIFEDITEAKRTEAFEKELLNLSPKLTGISLDEINTAIQLGISRIGEFLMADRAYIFEIDFHENRLSNTYEWCANGIAAEINNLQNLPLDTFLLTIEKLKQNEHVEIPSIADLPESWSVVKKILQGKNIQSLLVIPLVLDTNLIGFVGLDSIRQKRSYTTAEINILKVWSSLLSSLISNQRANKLIESTRRNYETFFNTIDDFLFVIDETGCIVHINDTVKERLGFTEEELMNQSILTVHPIERRDEAANVLGEMLAGNADYCPVPLMMKNGDLISVETRVKKGYWNNQPVIFGVSKDISQIKLSEQKFSSSFHSNSALMAITEYKTGKFIDVNNAFLQTFGYERDEVIGKSSDDLMFYSHLSHREYIFEKLKNNEKIIDFELTTPTKTGEKIYGLFSAETIYVGKELCVMGVFVNITKRKEAEAELSLKSGFLSDLLQSIPDLVFYKDMDGNYLGCNGEFCKFLGKEMDQIIGYNDHQLFGKEVADSFRHYDLMVLSRNEAMHNDECITYPDGSIRTIDTYKAPLRNSDGVVHGLLGISRDITYRKLIEDQLNAAKIEADRANLAKSEFLSRMSHELRTPMNSILGFAQLLELGELTKNQTKGVSHIMNSGKHLLELINEVLDISRIEAGHLSLNTKNIDLNELVSETTESINPIARQRNIVVQNSLQKNEQFVVKADTIRLKQVVLNLLNNAIKYNRDHGSITISTERLLDKESKKPVVRLSITDSGNGISEDNLKKLFKPFERIGAELTSIEGTGLGLSLAKKLTEAMYGKIGVQSELGVGSTFWIELPLEKGEQPTKRPKEVNPSAAMQDSLNEVKILYIEDNQMNIDLIEDIMASQRPNVNLITTFFGKMAVELAVLHMPNLILLDVNLPDIQGDEVLKELKSNEKTQNIPVIILSADAMDTQIRRLLNIGAIDYITKPIDVQTFLDLIDQNLYNSGNK